MKMNVIKAILSCFLLISAAVNAMAGGNCSRASMPGINETEGSIIDNRSDSIDILNTAIHLDFSNFSGKTIQGYTLLSCQSKVAGLPNINLDLLKLSIDSVLVDGINTAFSYNDTVLRVNFSTPYAILSNFELAVYYHGTPFQNPSDWGGFYWNSDIAYNIGVSFLDNPHSYGRTWFPCFDNFIERSFFDYFISVPKNYKAICGGLFIDTLSVDASKTEWHWKINQSIPSYLASVDIAAYEEIAYEYSGMLRTIPVRLYALASDTLKLRNSFIHLPDALTTFEAHYGPYQFDRVGYSVVPFSAGAMEHACNIAYMRAAVNGTTAYETLMAHELSHHWFGDLVTCETQQDMWLNEGWASYSEHLFLEQLYGRSAYDDEVMNNHDDVLRLAHTATKDGEYLALADVPDNKTYGTTVYDKGADVIHSIRGLMGDNDFFNCVQQYLEHYKFNHANSQDFINFMASCTDASTAEMLRPWIISPGFPHFAVSHFEVYPEAASNHLVFWLRQKLNHAPEYYNNQKVWVHYFDNDLHHDSVQVSFSGNCQRFDVETSFVPSFVVVDLNHLINDAQLDEYFVTNTTGVQDLVHARITLDIKEISGERLFWVSNNWVAPDSTPSIPNGLFLNNYRYWTIDGTFNETDKIDATFSYNGTNSPTSGFLDNDLMTNSEDSLVLMYRPNALANWQFADSFKVNVLTNPNNKVGKLNVYNLKKGEYVLAIWDYAHTAAPLNKMADCINVGLHKSLSGQLKFHIYPNPAKKSLQVVSENLKDANYKIFSMNGKLIQTGSIEDDNQKIELNTVRKGSYLLCIEDGLGNISTQKFIIN